MDVLQELISVLSESETDAYAKLRERLDDVDRLADGGFDGSEDDLELVTTVSSYTVSVILRLRAEEAYEENSKLAVG